MRSAGQEQAEEPSLGALRAAQEATAEHQEMPDTMGAVRHNEVPEFGTRMYHADKIEPFETHTKLTNRGILAKRALAQEKFQ